MTSSRPYPPTSPSWPVRRRLDPERPHNLARHRVEGELGVRRFAHQVEQTSTRLAELTPGPLFGKVTSNPGSAGSYEGVGVGHALFRDSSSAFNRSGHGRFIIQRWVRSGLH